MRWYGVLAVLVLAAGMSAPAAAQRERYEQVRPLDQILPQIRQSRPGTFYDAEGPFRGPDGRPHYRLKWMTPSGRILWLDTDAHTGRILGEERGPRRPAWERGVERRDQRRYAPRSNWRGDEYRNRRGGYYRERSRRDHDDGWNRSFHRGGDRGRPRSYDRGRRYERGGGRRHERGGGRGRDHRGGRHNR